MTGATATTMKAVKLITIPHPERKIDMMTRKRKTIITEGADLNTIDMPVHMMTIITDILFPIWIIGGPMFPAQMCPGILQHPLTSIYR